MAVAGDFEAKVIIPLVKPDDKVITEMLIAQKFNDRTNWRYNLVNIDTFQDKVVEEPGSTTAIKQFVMKAFLFFNQEIMEVSTNDRCWQNSIPPSQSLMIAQKAGTDKAARLSAAAGCGGGSWSFNGYCMYGGTADNPYASFNGCVGTLTIWLDDAGDNTSYWINHTSSSGTGGGGSSSNGVPTDNGLKEWIEQLTGVTGKKIDPQMFWNINKCQWRVYYRAKTEARGKQIDYVNDVRSILIEGGLMTGTGIYVGNGSIIDAMKALLGQPVTDMAATLRAIRVITGSAAVAAGRIWARYEKLQGEYEKNQDQFNQDYTEAATCDHGGQNGIDL